MTARSYDKRLLSRVRNSVMLINDMNHPNVVKFHKWYETRNHLWVVEEYCVGGTLRNLRSQDRYEPECSVRRFGVDLMAGLRYVHGRGITHCDLKPSKILINEYGVLKLTGFDVARRVTEKKNEKNKRGNSTPHYMAPELILEKDKLPYSFKSDLWAFGCVLYEMYFGEPPFVAGTISDLNKSIVHDMPRFEHVMESSSRRRRKKKKESLIKKPPSKHFKSLLCGLLEKNVTRRMDWTELLRHPFWTENKESQSAVEAIESDSSKLPREPVFESFMREGGKSNTSPDSKREYESHRVKKKKKNDDEDVEEVIRLLRGVNAKEDEENEENREEEKQRYVASTPSTISSPASMRKDRVVDRVERMERVRKQTSPVKKRPRTHQSKRRKSALERLESLNRKRNVVTAPAPLMKEKTFQSPSWNLLFRSHADINIRPIVGNRNIERMPPVTLNRNMRSDFTRHSISDLGEMISQEIQQSDDKSVEDKEKSSSELEEFFRNVLFALDEGSSATRGNVLSYLIHLMSPERMSCYIVSLSL